MFGGPKWRPKALHAGQSCNGPWTDKSMLDRPRTPSPRSRTCDPEKQGQKPRQQHLTQRHQHQFEDHVPGYHQTQMQGCGGRLRVNILGIPVIQGDPQRIRVQGMGASQDRGKIPSGNSLGGSNRPSTQSQAAMPQQASRPRRLVQSRDANSGRSGR